jgi:transposase
MSDGSKGRPKITAGVDLGDRYSYLCLIDRESGEVMEEGRLRTTPEAFRRRFASEQPMRIAIETGTHSPWASRVLQECGHEVLVANARKLRLIYANKRKGRLRSRRQDSEAKEEVLACHSVDDRKVVSDAASRGPSLRIPQEATATANLVHPL